MREIDIAIKNINRRTNNEKAFEASLHGYKLPVHSSPGQSIVSDENKEKASKASQMQIERLKARAQKRKANNG